MNWMNSSSGVVVLVGNASRDVTPQRSLSNQARILCLKYPDPSSIPMRPNHHPVSIFKCILRLDFAVPNITEASHISSLYRKYYTPRNS